MIPEEKDNLYDAVVVGGGPAGLTAALYLARARYRVVVVEKERFGGQIAITDEVVNYPGVMRASGAELTDTMRRQAESFGAEFMLAEVTSLELVGDVKLVKTSKGDLACLSVLLATGASPRRLRFPGEEEFRGRGVAYCATCDGEFFEGKEVFVVGGGFAAAEESVFLTRYAKHVTVLVRGDDFSCAPAAAEEAKANPKIDVLYNTQVVEAGGDSALRYLRYRNSKTGEEHEYRAAAGEAFGVFVFAGYVPATELARGMASMDERGYILTDDSKMTSANGLFAAGDVCAKGLRQVATAVGEAAQAATDMERYIKDAQERTGLVPKAPLARPQAAVASLASDAEDGKGARVAQNAGAPSSNDGDAEGAFADALFTSDMIAQLEAVFARMERPMVLQLALDDRPVSAELKRYADELAGLTDKLSVEVADDSRLEGLVPDELPCVRVCDAQGDWSGLAFHGVPGGHEFTSFVLGLYNASGPGQPIDETDRAAARGVSEDIDIKVLVSLSCTMCPDTVLAAQRIASLNGRVTAQAYDVAHFPQLKDAYGAMSVPCTVIRHADGRERVSFGRKNISQMLEELGK